MNLRKALDKARQMRGEGGRRIITGRPLVITRSPERDWKPPVYTQSRHQPVSADFLVENRCVCIHPDAEGLEAYKVLRTRIQQSLREKGWNTLLVTSSNPGDGKTLTAINLALTFAKAYNQTVMLLDCDLRRQNIHRVLGLKSEAGIVDFLVDEKPLHDFIIWPGIENLTLISGGRPIQNSAEILGSARMKSLVAELKSRYDDRILIIDAPPVLTGADTLALTPHVDAIVLVVLGGKTRLRDVKKSLEMLPPEKFLGYVLNSHGRVGSAYNYYG